MKHGATVMVCKKPLRGEKKMSPTAFVEQASDMAKQMIARESRGSGDIENAMRRLEARYGIPYATFWASKYRQTKTIRADLFARIAAAYEAEFDRQHKALEHERSITKAKGAFAEGLVRAADALAGEKDK